VLPVLEAYGRQNIVVFAARRYAYARPMCVCVCLSVTFVNSVETTNRIVRLFFHRRIDHHPSFSAAKRDGNTPMGTTLTGRRMQRGMKKITIFDHFISEIMQDRAIVTEKSE